MERDFELLLEFDNSESNDPIFYFYTWSEPAITLGKIQKQKDQVIQEAQRLGLPFYYRPTGGRAVLHGGDICYTFIAPQSHKVFGGTLKQSFETTNKFIKNIISEVLNFCIENSSVDSLHSSPDCFASTVTHEGIVNIKNTSTKIIGSAQALYRRAFIQQGSIQLNPIQTNSKMFSLGKNLQQITGINYDLEKICYELNQRI
jgi:lipoate-protein ligase A